MDLSKSYEFFKPEMLDKERVHIIGCGAVGSTIAENLARFGIKDIVLYDFDHVESHNIANQMFRFIDIGKPKVEALADILCEINPDIKDSIKLVKDGWRGQMLAGYVFLAVDNIDLRREIANSCKNNPYVKAMFDFRIGLTDAQHFAAIWNDKKMVENFIKTMNFSSEEAKAQTPVSACNVELSVVPTVRMICASGVSNFINLVKEGAQSLKKMILIDSFGHAYDAF